MSAHRDDKKPQRNKVLNSFALHDKKSPLEFYPKIGANIIEHYQAMFDNSIDGIMLCTPAGKVLAANPAACRMFDRTEEELRRAQRCDIVELSDVRAWQALLEREYLGSFFGLYNLRRANGSVFEAEVSTQVYTGKDGFNYAVFIIRDTTEHRKSEAALQEFEHEISRLERLNLISQMAASIAHEVRNPLTTVKGFLQVFKDNSHFVEELELFDLMIEELDRANQIITEFLSLAVNKPAELVKQDLNLQISNLLPLLTADANKKDVLVTANLGDIAEVLLDKDEIRQLILNLVMNGIDSMSVGGELNISTCADDDWVTLTVKDQGHGMPAEILAKAGTPFFTTKANGTGLGLAICFKIAKRHHAKLKIDSGPGGTAIRVAFPREWS